MITRHFIDVRNPDGTTRRVHYRRAGQGPAVLLVHQSPRSSLEYEALMHKWADGFTLFAPDTPGFGSSDPLPMDRPEVEDYADAAVAFIDALGLEKPGAYGFHSGAITLITAVKRHPERFGALAAVGYAVWMEAEKAAFAENYTPPFVAQPYGEHLTWLWSRILEQTWFFPWYRAHPDVRLTRPTDDPAEVHPIVMEMLQAGDNYRRGYGAVLRANRDVPKDGRSPPVLITAYDGDPLQGHIARLGELPSNWQAYPLSTAEEVEAACRDHLEKHVTALPPAISDASDEGFVHVRTPAFDGLLHWQGDRSSGDVMLHGPGSSAAALAARRAGLGALRLDLPGHGLSDDWPAGMVPSLDDWVAAVAVALPDGPVRLLAEDWSGLLALAVASADDRVTAVEVQDGHLPLAEQAAEWRERALTDIGPDRFGAYLLKAWQATRASLFFWPWFKASRESAIPFDPASADPAQLRLQHLAVMQGRASQRLLDVLIDADRTLLLRKVGMPVRWHLADWAQSRADVWKPAQQGEV